MSPTMAPSRLILMMITAAPVLAAQQPSDTAARHDRFPPNSVVARFTIAPSAFSGVTDAEELVQALRQDLQIEVAMPLKQKLQVAMSGTVRNPVEGGDFPFLNGNLGFVYDSSRPASARFADLVRSFHPTPFVGSWNEDSTWDWLVKAVDDGLTKSLAANGTFFVNDEGHVPLRVTGVHAAPAEQAESLSDGAFRSLYLKLRPHVELPYSLSDDEATSDSLGYDEQMILIGLEPGPRPALPTVELPVAALDALAGNYQLQPDKVMRVKREGAVLIASPAEGGEPPLRLKASSKTEFWSDSEGRRIEFIFALDGDGRAVSVTIKQSGFEMTAPRIP